MTSAGWYLTRMTFPIGISTGLSVWRKPVAWAFSLTGGIFAMTVMALAKRLSGLSIYGVSLLGAAAHNTGQILAAMVLLQSVYAAAYLPLLLAVPYILEL